MPIATTKADLLAVTRKEYAKLEKLIAGISIDQAMVKGEDDTSIKDIIAHRAHWIDLFQGWYADGQAGKEVHFPAKGYKWNQLKVYNAALRTEQAGLGWTAARDILANRHEGLVAWIEALDDAELYGAPMKGGRNAWTPGRWAEASGPSHYRSAARAIRAALRAAAKNS